MPRLALATLAAVLVATGASAQPVDVTFRFVPDLTSSVISPVERAFVPGTMPPGTMNDWGPNNAGVIQPGAASQATYVPQLNEYRYTVAVDAGSVHQYKIHYHTTSSPSSGQWITDPLGTETVGSDNNSVVRVTDPMVFQIAREQGGTGQVQAVSAGVFGTADVSSVQFTVNETTYTTGVTDTGDGVYRLELPAPVEPGAFVRVVATDAQGRTASAEVGQIPPTVTDRPVPDGLEDGITYDPNDSSRAWLVLRAPGKQYVYALGDFNGWTADDDALMFRDDAAPLGTRWWIELNGLKTGSEVPFYYWVDGQIRVADPYTTKVYYPGEAGYPAGAERHAVGVLTPGAAEFAWTDAGFEPPAQQDLVIYELLVRDFVAEHSFTALADTLDYLERLGVNAIELMPVSEFDGDESWGYNPAFHLALDKYYGTPDEFKAFVDAAHARGIAVILDVVYNHATGQSPLIRLYNDGDFGPPTADNPWANREATHPFNVFNDLDHTSPLTQLWLDKANRFWADEYHVDGYRYDLTGGFYQTGSYFEYNPQRIGVLKRMMGALWETNPETVVILEHLVENGQEWRELAAYRGAQGARPGPVLWHNMNREYSQGAMGYPTASDFPSTLTETYTPNWAGGVPVPNAVTYMESHDEQWLMYRTRAYGNVSGTYNTRDLFTALDRQRLAGVFFLTVPGPRMLWQFGELGYGGGPGECLVNGDYPGECSAGVPGRVANKPYPLGLLVRRRRAVRQRLRWCAHGRERAGAWRAARGVPDVGGAARPPPVVRPVPERRHRRRDSAGADGRPLDQALAPDRRQRPADPGRGRGQLRRYRDDGHAGLPRDRHLVRVLLRRPAGGRRRRDGADAAAGRVPGLHRRRRAVAGRQPGRRRRRGRPGRARRGPGLGLPQPDRQRGDGAGVASPASGPPGRDVRRARPPRGHARRRRLRRGRAPAGGRHLGAPGQRLRRPLGRAIAPDDRRTVAATHALDTPPARYDPHAPSDSAATRRPALGACRPAGGPGRLRSGHAGGGGEAGRRPAAGQLARRRRSAGAAGLGRPTRSGTRSSPSASPTATRRTTPRGRRWRTPTPSATIGP